MPLAKLGKTGAKVSILGLGAIGVSGRPRVLAAAMSEGVNFIDTAEGYDGSNSEKTIGEYLTTHADDRKKLFIVTKTGEHNPAELEKHLDASLQRLKTDYVDALYLHGLDDPNRLDDTLKAVTEALKKSKKLRFFGFSTHGNRVIDTLEKAAAVGFVDVLMLKYNFRDYDNAKLNTALDKCAKAKIGLVAMKTGAAAVPHFDEFKKEGLSPQVVSLKATWADKRIHVIVSQMNTVEHVAQNAAAAKERKMSRAEWDLLERYARATNHLYCRGCGELCESACEKPIAIADILRYRMYDAGYGDTERARELFAALPLASKAIADTDFRASEAACPYHLPIGELLADAGERLA